MKAAAAWAAIAAKWRLAKAATAKHQREKNGGGGGEIRRRRHKPAAWRRHRALAVAMAQLSQTIGNAAAAHRGGAVEASK